MCSAVGVVSNEVVVPLVGALEMMDPVVLDPVEVVVTPEVCEVVEEEEVREALSVVNVDDSEPVWLLSVP